MYQRNVFLTLLIFAVWTTASGQSANLLKNPGGDEGSEHWRAFKDAKVEQCPTGGRCFALRGGGYFIQDVVIPEDAVGKYVLFTGRGYTEGTNADGSLNGLPSLYGYMMNAGHPSGGRIYAYLSGQQMVGRADSSNNWTPLWGVFRVKSGTGRIRFFLQQRMTRGGDDGAVARFDDLGLYIFPTEQEARTLVSQYVPSIQVGPSKAIDEKSQCWAAGAVMPSLYGIQFGMSLQDVVSRFPYAVNEPNVVRALESSKSPIKTESRMLIVNRSGDHNLEEVRQLLFRFSHSRLFSLTVELNSPQWKNVEEFIDQRADLLGLLDLPPASAWEPVEGNPVGGKYLICHGIEVRFYAAPPGSANKNLISLTDITVERTLASASYRDR